MEQFHGKTIVLLNNKFKTIEGDKHGDQLMGQMDLIRSTASHGIRILVVNPDRNDVTAMMSDRLIPTDIEAKRKEVKANPTDNTGQISVDGYFKPNADRLARQAAAAQRKIEAQNPGQRVVVSYKLPEDGEKGPEYRKQKGLFGALQYQGIFTVRPTVNELQPNIIVLNISGKQLHDPKFIAGEGMNAALTQAFNFEDKLSALDHVLAELSQTSENDPNFEPRMALGKKLVDAILVDIAVEQASVLRFGWKSGASADTLRKSLKYLNRLGTYETKLDLSQASHAADLMADLVGGLQFLAKNQARWYERLPLPWAFFRRGPTVRSHTSQMAEQLRTQMFGPAESNSDALKARLRDRVNQLTQRRDEIWKQSREGKTPYSVKRSAVEAILEPLLGNDVYTDALYNFDRVIPESLWQKIHDDENELEANRIKLQSAKEQQKGDYLVVADGKVTDPKYEACTKDWTAMAAAVRKGK
jgi:hypothetical protein